MNFLQPSQTTLHICSLLQQAGENSNSELTTLFAKNALSHPLSKEDYLKACQELLGNASILPDSLLERQLTHLRSDNKLKLKFPSGYFICLTVIPCTSGGFRLDKNEIAQHRYFQCLVVDKNGICISGFSVNSSNVFKVLPAELQCELTFAIPDWEGDSPYLVSTNNRARFMALYEQTFRKAQELFDGKHTIISP